MSPPSQSGQSGVAQTAAAQGYTTICSIVTHKKAYIGKTVQLRALYKTDNSSYSYFKDLNGDVEGCRDKNIIQLGYISKMHNPTVVHFFADGDAICKKKNSSFCVLTAKVEFSAKVSEDKDGLYVDMEEVKNYSYY